MAERVKNFEVDYSKKYDQAVSEQVGKYETSIATQSLPAQGGQHYQTTSPDTHAALSRNQSKRLVLTALEQCYLVGIAAIVICLTICNLVIQYKDNQLAAATYEYQTKTSEVSNQTDLLLRELVAKYDYNTIKQIAMDNGMTLQKSQVRNVGE